MNDNILMFGADIFENVRSQKIGPLRWYVAKDVCEALDIHNSRDAVSRLDADERRTITMETSGGPQKMNAVSLPGIYRLIFSSRKEGAKAYQRWVTHDVLPLLTQESRHEIAVDSVGKQLSDLKGLLMQSGVVKPFVNPRYTFDNLMSRFLAAVPGNRPRDFYEAVGEWYGIAVPYSSKINITVKEWLLEHIPLEVMTEFVVGVESKTIIRCQTGRWISLNGVFGNTVDWERIKKEFGYRCAYCGKEHAALIPEHLVPQSVMSKTAPEKVDLIENIVPACVECNGGKGLLSLSDWYTKHPAFSKARLRKIQEHYRKYKLE